jgi:hypothetical protein
MGNDHLVKIGVVIFMILFDFFFLIKPKFLDTTS